MTATTCRLDDFREVVERTTDPGEYPRAASVEQNILIYDGPRLDDALRADLLRALSAGPGVVVFRRALGPGPVDAATAVFEEMIASQPSVGDHFAKPGANDRVWNALQKLAFRAPEVFCDYYASDVIAFVSAAWLGAGYQVTSQVNVVNPGGAAQVAHRDYHLGFQSAAAIEAYPEHVHRLSPALTLQGAVAHCDMPVESGPTMYLPHSQKFEAGYLAWRLPEFTAYFDAHYVQLPLEKGDAVFFNPALFHAAGHNRSAHIRRMANLLQISSAFGRAMETADREAMANALYPVLLRRSREGAPW